MGVRGYGGEVNRVGMGGCFRPRVATRSAFRATINTGQKRAMDMKHELWLEPDGCQTFLPDRCSR